MDRQDVKRHEINSRAAPLSTSAHVAVHMVMAGGVAPTVQMQDGHPLHTSNEQRCWRGCQRAALVTIGGCMACARACWIDGKRGIKHMYF